MAIDAVVQDAAPKTIVISGPVARGTADGNSDTDTLVVTDPDKRVFDMESERTHDLRAILAAIAPGGREMDQDIVMEAGTLSDCYMATRCPDYGGLDDANGETAEEAYQWPLGSVG